MQHAINAYNKLIRNFESMSFEQRREAVSASKSPSLKDKLHTKSTLKALFRVKPKKDAISSYSYKNEYGKHIECFTLAQCQPMRALSIKPRSQAQIQASENLVNTNRINCPANQAALRAQLMIDEDTVVIDTETTSLTGAVIQIALVSLRTGEVLYKSLVATNETIEEEAKQVHGITQQDLVSAPTFDAVALQISQHINQRKWTAYNIEFDAGALSRSIVGDPQSDRYAWIKQRGACVMKIAVPVCGSTNKYGSISLSNALISCGLNFEGRAHDAANDARSTAKLIQYIASTVINEK